MIKDYFALGATRFPEQRTQLRRVSLALRREQIHTMEQLCRLRADSPEGLLSIRAIGAKRLGLIEAVCRQYESDRVQGQEEETN